MNKAIIKNINLEFNSLKKLKKPKKIGKKLVLPDKEQDETEQKEQKDKKDEVKVKRKVLEFYSKSRDSDDIGSGFKDWRKRLSYFWVNETGKTIRKAAILLLID